MSFILDALKKLEQKRQRGTVPDVMTVHVPEHREKHKRPILFYLISVALILNAVILGLWFLPKKEGEDTAFPNTSVEQHKIQNISASGQRSSAGVQHESTPPLVTTEPKLSVEKTNDNLNTPLKKLSTHVATTEKQNTPLRTKKAGIKTAQDHFTEPQSQADNPSNVSAGPKSMLHETDPVSTVKNETAASLSSASVFNKSEVNKAEHPQGIPELSQLPQNIQSEIPKMTILGHIYSDSSATRMVNINGNIFREGDMVVKNIRIENITENGAVFEYNGLHFRIQAF